VFRFDEEPETVPEMVINVDDVLWRAGEIFLRFNSIFENGLLIDNREESPELSMAELELLQQVDAIDTDELITYV